MLVLVQLVQKTTDLVAMNNPNTSSYTRPIYVAEVKEMGEISFQDQNFNFGINLISRHLQSNRETPISLPENIGRFVSLGLAVDIDG